MTVHVLEAPCGGCIPAHRAEQFETKERMADDDDTACMRRLAAGDDSALAEIVKRWHAPLLNFFYRSTGSREDAEDLTQNVMVKLYRAAPRYRVEARFSTYLFVIARRALQNHRRFFRRKLFGLVDNSRVPEIYLAESGAGRVREIEDFFQTALKTLPEAQRTAILLLKQQGMTYSEIADAMGTTESRVRTWIFRARQKLKEAYDETDR
jgi:RNA polymerase sigma-70 factor, ECF subfamily